MADNTRDATRSNRNNNITEDQMLRSRRVRVIRPSSEESSSSSNEYEMFRTNEGGVIAHIADSAAVRSRKRSRCASQSSASSSSISHEAMLMDVCKQGDVGSLNQLLTTLASNPRLRTKVLEHQDEDGFTALMIATRYGHVAICHKLLSLGITVNASNEKGNSSLIFAAQKGLVSVSSAILAAGASLELVNASIIPAAHFGHDELVQLLLQYGASSNYVNAKGTTALMRAAQEGRAAVLKTLIKAGAVINASNGEGMTALMLAAQRGHHEIATILLRSGAKVNMHTRQGSTALVLSAKRGHEQVVRVLVAAGADIFKQDDRQKTAYDTAMRRGYVNILDLLTVETQLRLMRQAKRAERSLVLVKLSLLYTTHRARVPARLVKRKKEYIEVLTRALSLPSPLVESIASMLPLPRLWNTQLRCLMTRCNAEPNAVVRDGLTLIDEVLLEAYVDAVTITMDNHHHSTNTTNDNHGEMDPQPPMAPKSGLVAYMAESRDFRQVFEQPAGALEMSTKLLFELRKLASIQSSVMHYGETNFGFKHAIGSHVVSTARLVLKWYYDHVDSTTEDREISL